MARGSDQATGAATTAANTSAALQGNASNLYAGLAPQLAEEATSPSGYSPADLAAMNTAAQQSAGGATAGATGRGALLAARTRNAGAADAAIADAARSGGQQLSNEAVGTQVANANLKQRQQQAGLSGLEGLYGENLGAGINSEGQVAGDVNANTGSTNASWDWASDILDPVIKASGQAAAAKLGCWIAEAIYGVDDPRTFLARAWLNGPFKRGIVGRVVMATYLAVGQKVAVVVRRSGILRRTLKPLFDIAVRKAGE